VVGVLILVRVVTDLPAVAMTAWQFMQGSSGISVLSPVAIELAGLLLRAAIGIALIVFPATLAGRVTRGELAAQEPVAELQGLQTVLFATLGLYFVAEGLIGIASTAATIQADHNGSYAADPTLRSLLVPASWSGLLRSTIRFRAGMGILLGAGKLSRFINRLTRKPADPV
jgi:hypothetical protein